MSLFWPCYTYILRVRLCLGIHIGGFQFMRHDLTSIGFKKISITFKKKISGSNPPAFMGDIPKAIEFACFSREKAVCKFHRFGYNQSFFLKSYIFILVLSLLSCARSPIREISEAMRPVRKTSGDQR